MKKLFLISAALFMCLMAGAQEFTKGSAFNPKKGDFSFGVAYNPMSEFASYQPEIKGFAGEFIKSLGEYPYQMYFLGVDPKVSFMFRKHITDNWAARVSLGFSGSKVNYKEYIRDDVSYHLDPDTENREVDCVHGILNGISLSASAEYHKSFGRLAFIAGAGLQFASGGGKLTFEYGNGFDTESNGNAPSVMPYCQLEVGELKTLNKYNNNKIANVNYARPLERYNVGDCKALALIGDMGVEYFFIGQMSISAAVTFAPLTFYWQPQTYAKFEGYDTKEKKVVEFNALVSPGSSAVLYGTQNFGVRIGFHYYL